MSDHIDGMYEPIMFHQFLGDVAKLGFSELLLYSQMPNSLAASSNAIWASRDHLPTGLAFRGWMEGGWMRMQRTSASLRVHPPSEYVRRMILMMNHPNLMLFGASVGDHGMFMFGGASWWNGAENVAENATILWASCTIVAKSATKNAMQQSKNYYARSLVSSNIASYI